MFEIRRYSAERKQEWDAYVSAARNATFLFCRDYMDYHACRYSDCSLMFYRAGKLHSLLPAHSVQQTFCSHSGLTYGGLIMDAHVTAADTCTLFAELNDYLRGYGFNHVLYRPIPWIYHRLPSEEDLYAIFQQCHARLAERSISTTLPIQQQVRWRNNHRRMLKKAENQGVTVKRGADLAEFWPLLEANLAERYHARPVHSLQEIQLLQARFPQNIIQYSAYHDGTIIGGITLYLSPQVVHTQYISTNSEGKRLGAAEAICSQIACCDYPTRLYMDFGTSTEDHGRLLNPGLIGNKEGYGGRAVVYDTYEWDL